MAPTATTTPHGMVMKWEDDGSITTKACFKTVVIVNGVEQPPFYSTEMSAAEALAAGFPVADAVAILTAALP